MFLISKSKAINLFYPIGLKIIHMFLMSLLFVTWQVQLQCFLNGSRKYGPSMAMSSFLSVGMLRDFLNSSIAFWNFILQISLDVVGNIGGKLRANSPCQRVQQFHVSFCGGILLLNNFSIIMSPTSSLQSYDKNLRI